MDIEHSPLSHTELAGLRSQMQLCPGLYDSTTQRLVATIDAHKVNTAEARGIVFDLDEELAQVRIERDDLRKTLEISQLANTGHVRMIADLAAERDQIKRELEAARKALGVTE